MKKLSKRDDDHRQWKSFKRHLGLTLQPLTVSAITTFIWFCALFENEIHFHKEDEAPLMTGVFLFLSVAYAIITATTFETVWSRYQKIVASVLKKDKESFLHYRDERIPIILHLLIFAFSTPILLFVMLIEYHTAIAGGSAVFATMLGLYSYYVVIAELQDPKKAIWFAERIPPEWIEVDIDEFFELTKEDPK